MITEERYWALLVESNPIPDADTYGSNPVDASAYLATLEKRSSDMSQTETEARPHPSERTDRNRRFGVALKWAAGAALVALVAAIGLLISRGSEEPVAESAELEIALEFMEARASHDGDKMASLFAGDAVLENELFVVASDYTLGADFERAIGMVYTVDQCVDSAAPDGSVRVTCYFTGESDWSRALGREPVSTNNIRFVIDDGKIQLLTHTLNWAELTVVQTAFMDWVRQNHPADIAVMFRAEDLDNPVFVAPRPLLTPATIDQFEEYTAAYLAESTGG